MCHGILMAGRIIGKAQANPDADVALNCFIFKLLLTGANNPAETGGSPFKSLCDAEAKHVCLRIA
jgi:hypothetical protein